MTLTPDQLSESDVENLHSLQTDFPFFATNCLMVEPKEGGEIVPFIFNEAQWYLFDRIMDMWRRIGYVRIIVVKGRQQGISTLIEGFLYWLMVTIPYFTASIISHESSATEALADKIETFNDNCPDYIKPKLVENNPKKLRWDNNARCIIFTAGSKNTGRGRTAQGQHQSERGFFENPGEIDAGAGQIVAKIPNTFVFKESTGNGQNFFWRETNEANDPESDSIFEVVFIPFYWQKEYRARVPQGFVRTEYEHELCRLYPIDDEVLQWRREKISEFNATFGKGDRIFKQEYPFTLDEAFQASGESYFDSEDIIRARKSTYVDNFAPLVMGVDPGRDGDRTIIVLRRGRQITEVFKYKGMDEMRLVGIVSNLIDTRGVQKCMIDYGQGTGTVDRLRELGYRDIVDGVWFNETPEKEIYGNKRAEMYVRGYNWFKDGECNIPDDDDMASDLLCIRDPEPNSSGKIYFESKKDIKKRIKRSPDIADAFVLTFARYVRLEEHTRFPSHTRNTSKGSGLTTLARVRNNKEREQTDGFSKAPNQSRFKRFR